MEGESPTLRSNDSRSIKLGGDAMLKILEGIIQKILSAKDTPSHLSKMLVTSVFTKSDSCKPGNYAAIDLLLTCSMDSDLEKVTVENDESYWDQQ